MSDATTKIAFSAFAIMLIGFFYVMMPPTGNAGANYFNTTINQTTVVNLNSSGLGSNLWDSLNPLKPLTDSINSLAAVVSHPADLTNNTNLPPILIALIMSLLFLIGLLGVIDVIHGAI